ncbi:hypothetical protein QBC40DRAFT_272502 [Triangularia verruculosa]|uniref:Uncharacterized protein n=1 Tax=Triangularia verruculosa TaxID=2587418 RepID=A0AAN7B127_9PEZI|nr:hypothetical protein QBC40DRAFT_272502 [Triangularia verruculosa]
MQFTTIALALFATLAIAAPRPRPQDGVVNVDDIIATVTDNLNGNNVVVPVAAPVSANVGGEQINSQDATPGAIV